MRVIKVEVWEHEGNSAIYEELLNTTQDNGHIPADPQQSLFDLKEKEIEASAIENDEVKNEVIVNDMGQIPAPMYATKTNNSFSDPFAGTSWGNS